MEIADLEVNVPPPMGTSTPKRYEMSESSTNEIPTETLPKESVQTESTNKEETCLTSTPKRYVRTRPSARTVWKKNDTQAFSSQKKMLFDVLTSERKRSVYSKRKYKRYYFLKRYLNTAIFETKYAK